MRKIRLAGIFTALFILPLKGILIAETNGAAAEPDSLPFLVGENLQFAVYFEFILGGYARMAVEAVDTINGKPCLRIVSQARSTKTIDTFYRVRDRIATYRDIAGGFSRRYEKQLREGKHKFEKIVQYFPEDSVALISRNSEDVPDTIDLPGYVQDVLSAFYEMRLRDLDDGGSVFIAVHDIDKRYNLEVKIYGRERIEVPAGTFDCIKVEPMLQSSGIFRRDGELQIWLTDDKHKIPVLMQSRLYFGRVWAKLIEYTLGGQ